MVILILLTMPFVSSLFALSAQRRIAAREAGAAPFDHLFFRGLLYVVLICMPVTAYFFYARPAWALAYLIEPGRLPITFGLVMAMLLFSGYFFFYLAVQAVIQAHRPVTAALASAQLVLAALLFAIVFRHELSMTGSYAAFHTGTAVPLGWATGLFEVITGLLLLAAPATAVIVRNLREGRAYPPIESEETQW
jgi:hypothetical protein